MLPEALQLKALEGMFQSSDQLEQIIDDEGKKALAMLKHNDSSFDYSDEEEEDEGGEFLVAH